MRVVDRCLCSLFFVGVCSCCCLLCVVCSCLALLSLCFAVVVCCMVFVV